MRVCQRQTPEVRGNLEALEQALRQVYVSPHQQFLRRQELNNRTQGPLESLENYLDVDARAARLQLTDAETMQCFVQGFRQELKEHVYRMYTFKEFPLISPPCRLAEAISSIKASLEEDDVEEENE